MHRNKQMVFLHRLYQTTMSRKRKPRSKRVIRGELLKSLTTYEKYENIRRSTGGILKSMRIAGLPNVHSSVSTLASSRKQICSYIIKK